MKKALLVALVIVMYCSIQAMQESGNNNQEYIPSTSSLLFKKTAKGALSFSSGAMLLMLTPSAALASIITPLFFTNLGTGEFPVWTALIPLYALASAAGGCALLKDGAEELHSVAKELQAKNNGGVPSQRTSLCSRKMAAGGVALMLLAGAAPVAWAMRKK